MKTVQQIKEMYAPAIDRQQLYYQAKAVRSLISLGMDSKKALSYAVNTYNLTGSELKALAYMVFHVQVK